MPTEVVWNEAKPPKSQGEHIAAEYIVIVAREVDLTEVTDENIPEWLWRAAFTRAVKNVPFDGLGALRKALERFNTVTLTGRVESLSREAWIKAYLSRVAECAREEADGALAEVLEVTAEEEALS